MIPRRAVLAACAAVLLAGCGTPSGSTRDGKTVTDQMLVDAIRRIDGVTDVALTYDPVLSQPYYTVKVTVRPHSEPRLVANAAGRVV